MNQERRSRLRQRLLEKYTKRADQKDIEKIDKKLGSMQRGPITEIWDKVQLLWRFALDPNVPWVKKAAAIGAFVYLISPLDAVPDVIPVGGLLDDVAVILFTVRMLADSLKQYVVDRAEAKVPAESKNHSKNVWAPVGPIIQYVTKKWTQAGLNNHYKKVWASVIGAIIITGLSLVLRLPMSFTETDLLAVYRILLLCAAIGTLFAGLHRARKWIARYQRSPRVLQQSVKQGVYAALKRYVREERPKQVGLILLQLILSGLTIAVWMI